MTKSRIIIYFLVAMLATSMITTQADAQWWKRRKEKRYARKHKREQEVAAAGEPAAEGEILDKKELKRREKLERKRIKRERRRMHRSGNEDQEDTQVTRVKTRRTKKKREPEYAATKMKPVYRIDFLAALYLDELVKNGNLTFKDKIPDKAFPGISFYEGLNIAADSLKKAGFNIDIYVHDISSANESPEKLIASGKLDSADLIIGAFHSQDMTVVADYARKKQVNFISALSPADGGVKDNLYFTMTQPSLKTHCEWIVDDVSKKFQNKNVIMLHRAATQVDENAFGYINSYNDGNVHFKDLVCNGLPGKGSLQSLIDTGATNILVVSVIDPGFADSLLVEVSSMFRNTHFEVYGMPSWYVIDDLHEDGALPNMSVNVTMPFNIDRDAAVSKYVAHKFKSEYGGKASELVFRGYETMYWYASLLKQYGTIFNLNYSDIAGAPFTKYDVKLKKDKQGNVLYNENNHIYLYKYGYETGNVKAD